MPFLAFIFTILLIFLPSMPVIAATSASGLVQAQVTYIDDGDTFKVKLPNKIIMNVRLGCVDAPEVPHTKIARDSTNKGLIDHYTWGAKSLAFVQSIMPVTSNVNLLIISTDYRYGRTVAEVILPDGSNLAQREIALGLAQNYDGYIDLCPDKATLIASQLVAKNNRVGLWSDIGYMPPAIARQQALVDTSKSTPVTPIPPVIIPVPPVVIPMPPVAIPTPPIIPVTPVPPVSCTNCGNSGGTTPVSPTTLPACTLTKCNCSDFKTQAEAQVVLKAFPTDKFGLDRNHDGIACNGLRKIGFKAASFYDGFIFGNRLM